MLQDWIPDMLQDWIPDMPQDWSRHASRLVPRSISRISYLIIWCLEAVILASDLLTLSGPRIGYARLVSARNVPNHSTIMDYSKVL